MCWKLPSTPMLRRSARRARQSPRGSRATPASATASTSRRARAAANEPTDRLVDDQHARAPAASRRWPGGEDLDAPQAVCHGALAGRRASRAATSDERDRGGVGEHVRRVGEQRERVRDAAATTSPHIRRRSGRPRPRAGRSLAPACAWASACPWWSWPSALPLIRAPAAALPATRRSHHRDAPARRPPSPRSRPRAAADDPAREPQHERVDEQQRQPEREDHRGQRHHDDERAHGKVDESEDQAREHQRLPAMLVGDLRDERRRDEQADAVQRAGDNQPRDHRSHDTRRGHRAVGDAAISPLPARPPGSRAAASHQRCASAALRAPAPRSQR